MENIVNKVKCAWGKLPSFLKNKYILSFLLLLIWLLIFDNNNAIERIKGLRKINKLKKERIYYNEKIVDDTKQLNDLKTNKSNIEKYAREQYFMKKANEDIFVIKEE